MKPVVNDNDADGLPQRPIATHEPKVPKDRVGIAAVVKIWIAVTGWKLVVVRVRLVHFVIGNEPVEK